MSQRVRRALWAAAPRKLEPLFFLGFAAICTLLSARRFFDSRYSALRMSEAARQMLDVANPVRHLEPVAWSTPLADVFIPFDFARSLAQGHFFHWAPGSGYSSGATSWLYPALLGIAYRAGLTDFALGYFSDWFAVMCVFGGFLALRHAFADRAWWFHYLVVAAFCFQGVLAFLLWSGMEFALFFLVWCCAHSVFQTIVRNAVDRSQLLRVWLLGALGSLLAATRPEGLVCVVVWGYFVVRSTPALPSRRRTVVLRVAAVVGPCCTYLVVRAGVNRWLTGEFADAGSLAKLELLAPYRSLADFPWQWLKNVGFQFVRVTTYHAGTHSSLGWLFWVGVVSAFIARRTRPDARVLGAMALLWSGLVASNEYVRYQNDRYTMAPLAWLMLCAVLAIHDLLRAARDPSRKTTASKRAGQMGLALLLVVAWSVNQAPRFAHQAWLFGRASRNISEQQVRLGLLRGASVERSAHRRLLGDAGALTYFSRMAGVDAFGLGTTQQPFARAARLGNGATVELIERMPELVRPDLMALYPSWWQDLPLWFGKRLLEINITGNVMCGARSKVLYRSDWSALEGYSLPAAADQGWRVVDELDVADLVSETEHDFGISRRPSGYVYMKILPKAEHASQDLFDAGRILFDGDSMHFRMPHVSSTRPVRLVFRAAPHAPMKCQVAANGREWGRLAFTPRDSWVETVLELGSGAPLAGTRVTIRATEGECNLFHIWALQPE